MGTNHTDGRKPKITLISPTAGTMAQFEKAGFADRQITLIQEYAKYFDVEYYTSDVKNYSELLQVRHRPIPIRLDIPGIRHCLFWLYLVIRAPFMKGFIRTFGVELPTLPLVRLFSGRKVIAGFQWNYATQTRANYRGIKRWLANPIQRLGFAGADAVICTADWLKALAEKRYRKKAWVIPNFVDFGIFNHTLEKEDYILYAGRLHWSKGLDVLLNAFKTISAACPGFRLLICGTGEMECLLKGETNAEGISNVEFRGTVAQKKLGELMARAKVFVLPTITLEGHPKALIEAMAAGTACVATRVPGNAEVIDNGITGILVPPNSRKDLGDAVIRILNEPSLRTKLEAGAYEYAQAFRINRVISREVELISNFVGISPPSPGKPELSPELGSSADPCREVT